MTPAVRYSGRAACGGVPRPGGRERCAVTHGTATRERNPVDFLAGREIDGGEAAVCLVLLRLPHTSPVCDVELRDKGEET
jgi:hypothetical protein